MLDAVACPSVSSTKFLQVLFFVQPRSMQFTYVRFANGDLDIYRILDGTGYPWLAVRDSLMMQRYVRRHGKGLYALRQFCQGEIIGRYSGKIVALAKDISSLCNDSDKLLTMQAVVIDGAQPPQTAAEQCQMFGKVVFDPKDWPYPGMSHFMANDAVNTPMQHNSSVDSHGFMVITQQIPVAYVEGGCPHQNARSELFWSYGPTYWAKSSQASSPH